jgi:putative CocE/NonD family hydrolase
MRIRHEFPRRVTVRDHVLVPMRDGTLLSARIWLPDDAEAAPVPALVEYLPYRKSDWTSVRDAQRHPWYAGHGYASIRIDMRGCGDSEGLMHDEYLPQEQLDAVDAIAWIAEQPWCTGSVGMFGISWGGFNSLQVAALRPPALKAVVTVCSTDDRYADDVHYWGGSMLGIDMPAWAATMLAHQARPPDPARVGGAWRKMWLERLENLRPFAETWMAHQERDDYWRQGSVCEDYSAIEAAVYAVGGWADPYRNTVLRLVEGLSCPVKGLVGPWSHQYPDRGLPPGPAIGFLQETLRWWDHWLKGVDTGVMDEPPLRTWMQAPVPPRTSYDTRPGRWIAEPSWPSPNVTPRSWTLDDGPLRPAGQPTAPTASVPGGTVLVSSPQHTGVDAGRFFPFGNPADLPPDQRAEDGRSVCFDSAPLAERVEILGLPEARLLLDCDRPAGQVVVRLCDLAPDGSSTLVTRGNLNLVHRDGDDAPRAWTPGTPERVGVRMTAIAHTFEPGHRIRLAVSSAYWPWVWPAPEPVALALRTGDDADCSLLLPVREPASPEPVLADFNEPEQAAPLPFVPGPASGPERQVRYDPQTDTWELVVDPNYGGTRTYPDGLVYEERVREAYLIRADDPLSARAESTWDVALSRGDWRVEISTRSVVTASATHFVTDNQVIAREGGTEAFSRSWHAEIPRTSA